jgi:hypothetical protein
MESHLQSRLNLRNMSAIDMGNVPAWVGAVFAGAAALGALLTLKSQRTQIGEQREFIRAQSEVLELQRQGLVHAGKQRGWQQAQKVKFEVRTTNLPPLGKEDRRERLNVMISNKSGAPVRDVQVVYGTEYLAEEVFVREPGRESRRIPTAPPLSVLAPLERAEFLSPELFTRERPHVYFTDGENQRWHADDDGSLHPLAPGEAEGWTA